MKRLFTIYDRIVGRIIVIAAFFGGVLLLAVTGITFYEILMRYVFKSPTVWSLDIAGLFLLWAVFLGASYTLREKGHIFVELIVNRLSVTARTYLGIFTHVLILPFFFIIIWFGAVHCIDAYKYHDVTNSFIRIPLYLPMLSIPVGGVLLMLESISQILAIIIKGIELKW